MAGTYCEPERIELAGFVEQCVEATMSTLAILHGHPGSLPYGTLQKLREAFKEAADNFEAVDPGTLPAH